MAKQPTNTRDKQVKFGATSYKQALFLNHDSFLTVYGGAAGCYRGDAEYLSEDGWKSISEYDGGLVTQWDSKTNKTSLVQPLEFIKKPCNEFKRMTAKGLDFILTDEHRVPYFNEHDLDTPKVISWKEAQERHLKSKSKGWTGKIKTTFNVDKEGLPLTLDEIKLQVAIQADGSIKYIKNNGDKSVSIRVSKDRKAERLTALLDKLGIDYSYKKAYEERYSNHTRHSFYFSLPIATKLFSSEWYNCSQEQLQTIVDEVGYWDGSLLGNSNNTSIRYYSAIKENADFIQYAFHACGYNTSMVKDNGNNKSYTNDCWTVNGSPNGKGLRSFVGKGYKQDITLAESTDGFKYCFSVPSTFLVMRQNNKIFISGNSGKSFTGLLKFLKWCDDPDFVGYVFRLHATDLKKEGGAFWTAVKIFQAFRKGTTFTQQPMVIRFPSGASVSFLGMDDKAGREAIQGIEISAAMCDEATHFQEEDIWWIISRLRTNAAMSPCIWLTCNPSPHSFILDWIKDYYIHPEGTFIDDELVEGRPIDDTNGNERFYLRVGNDLHWGDTFKELYDKHHSKFGIDPYTKKNMCKPRSFRFIGASCFDNPEMLKKNPDYVSSLASQPRVTMERLLKGNWLAVEEESGYFKKSWVRELNPKLPEDMTYLSKVTKRVRAWDIAGTVPSEASPNPDFTAGVLIARTRDGDFVIEDVQHVRKRSGENLEFILKIAEDDRRRFGNQLVTLLPIDPAEAGKAIKIVRAKEFALRGIPVKFEKVGTRNSKLDKFIPFSSAAENGCVCVVKADWNPTFYRELEAFDGISRRFHDDIVDSTASAYNHLKTTKEYKKLNPAMIG